MRPSKTVTDRIDCWAKQQLLDSSGGSIAYLRKFDLLYKFVNQAVNDPLIGKPPRMTWLDKIIRPANDDEYALKLIFVLICSKRAKDSSLHVLEAIVNNDNFSLDWVRHMNMSDLIELISPIGLQNKNAIDIMETFWDIHCRCQRIFPRTLESITEPNGVGTKIGLLVLYFAFGINDGVPVDSHVRYVSHAIGLVPDFVNTDEAVCYTLELCLPRYTWPLVNIIFASLGQLLADTTKADRMIQMAQFTPPYPSIVKILEKMANHYKRKDNVRKNSMMLTEDDSSDNDSVDGIF